eukprot:gene8613-biopygen11008
MRLAIQQGRHPQRSGLGRRPRQCNAGPTPAHRGLRPNLLSGPLPAAAARRRLVDDSRPTRLDINPWDTVCVKPDNRNCPDPGIDIPKIEELVDARSGLVEGSLGLVGTRRVRITTYCVRGRADSNDGGGGGGDDDDDNDDDYDDDDDDDDDDDYDDDNDDDGGGDDYGVDGNDANSVRGGRCRARRRRRLRGAPDPLNAPEPINDAAAQLNGYSSRLCSALPLMGAMSAQPQRTAWVRHRMRQPTTQRTQHPLPRTRCCGGASRNALALHHEHQ